MRRVMAYWSLSEDGLSRTLATSPFAEDLLVQAAEQWPMAELEVTYPESYCLLPGFGKTAIPLGKTVSEAEASLRMLLERARAAPRVSE